MIKPLFSGLLLSAIVLSADAQPDCFARVTLDRHQVYVQQPIRITITVLTATWYTAPLAFDNIQVPSAFALAFDRTTPGMFEEGGRHYAGLQFYYLVFPYREGEFVFPAIELVAQTPAAGSSQSRKITISTPEQHFLVKPVPVDEKEDWFVAKDVAVSQQWNRSLKELSVGDVISRTIGIRAKGTLPQFIHPPADQPLDFANTYPQEAGLLDERTAYDAGGSLTQRVLYLLDKAGDFVLPAVTVQWWDPNRKRLYSRSAEAVKIHVKANPNLGMLTTLRDSLGARAVKQTIVKMRQKLKFFGMDWYWALLLLLVGLFFVYQLMKIVMKNFHKYKTRHATWLSGEAYAFRRLMRSSNTVPSFIPMMYRWWDKFALPNRSLSITNNLQQNEQLKEELKNCLKNTYGPGTGDVQLSVVKKEMRGQRRKWRQDQNFASGSPT